MDKGIIREVLAMRRRGHLPEAIMRKWRLTPEQYAAMTNMGNVMVQEVAGEAELWSNRAPPTTGMSKTAGY